MRPMPTTQRKKTKRTLREEGINWDGTPHLRTRDLKTYVIRRNIYVHADDEETWVEAVLFAERKNASLSAIIAAALSEYLKHHAAGNEN